MAGRGREEDVHPLGFQLKALRAAVPASQVWGRKDLIPGVNRWSLGDRHQGQKNRAPGHNFLQLPRGPRTVGTHRDGGSVYPTHLGPNDQETEQWNYMWDRRAAPLLLSLNRAAAPCPVDSLSGSSELPVRKAFRDQKLLHTPGAEEAGAVVLSGVQSKSPTSAKSIAPAPGRGTAGRADRAPSRPVAAPAAPQHGARARTDPEPASSLRPAASSRAPARALAGLSPGPRSPRLRTLARAPGPPRPLRARAVPPPRRCRTRWCAPARARTCR